MATGDELIGTSHVCGLNIFNIIPRVGDRLTADIDPFFAPEKVCIRLKDDLARVVGHLNTVNTLDNVAGRISSGHTVYVNIPEGATVTAQLDDDGERCQGIECQVFAGK